MLSEPEAGWSFLSIDGKDIGPVSYMDDVPMIALDAFIKRLDRHGKSSALMIDLEAEGYHVGIVEFNHSLYALNDNHDTIVDSELILFVDDSCLKRLGSELVRDIRASMEAWIDWNPDSFDYLPEEDKRNLHNTERRRGMLMQRCLTLEALCR
jgi:hypothetical protein